MGGLRKIVSFRIFVALIGTFLLSLIPQPWSFLLLLGVIVGVYYGIWRLRQRRCAVCGARETYPAYQEGHRPRPLAWWDLRLPSTKHMEWCCLPHALLYGLGHLPPVER